MPKWWTLEFGFGDTLNTSHNLLKFMVPSPPTPPIFYRHLKRTKIPTSEWASHYTIGAHSLMQVSFLESVPAHSWHAFNLGLLVSQYVFELSLQCAMNI